MLTLFIKRLDFFFFFFFFYFYFFYIFQLSSIAWLDIRCILFSPSVIFIAVGAAIADAVVFLRQHCCYEKAQIDYEKSYVFSLCITSAVWSVT